MVQSELLAAWVATQYLAVRGRLGGPDAERGDVPGWVMVTVMTAGLVVGIFAAFKTKIASALDTAISSVTSGTSG